MLNKLIQQLSDKYLLAPSRGIGGRIRKFVQLESAGGILLGLAAIAAMIVKNSPLNSWYDTFLKTPGIVAVGDFSIEKPLFLWVNDFQMAIFFLLVAMEIKREFVSGYLRDRRQLVLPGVAAVGGFALPALIYVAFNWGNDFALSGWAIPAATDIAFALAVLSLVTPTVPIALRIFLLTLAIIDDLFAIIAIALFYTSSLSITALVTASGWIGVLVLLRFAGVRNLSVYTVIGIVLWVTVLKSGVHATLAGVVTGLFIPADKIDNEEHSPLENFIHFLHPWVAFLILPLFAFVNAGIDFDQLQMGLLFSGVSAGIIFGLLVGKPLGILGAVWLVTKNGWATLPQHCGWRHMLAVAVICGIGFTMSIFIGGLAFAEGGAGYAVADRAAIVLSSTVAGVIGFILLKWAVKTAEQVT